MPGGVKTSPTLRLSSNRHICQRYYPTLYISPSRRALRSDDQPAERQVPHRASPRRWQRTSTAGSYDLERFLMSTSNRILIQIERTIDPISSRSPPVHVSDLSDFDYLLSLPQFIRKNLLKKLTQLCTIKIKNPPTYTIQSTRF